MSQYAVPASIQAHENDHAKLIMVHEPSMPVFMGALHPDGSLFESSVDLGKALQQHNNLVKVLEKNGIEVKRVRDVLEMDCEENLLARISLEHLAMKCLTYALDPTQAETQLDTHDHYLLSDEYKEKVISEMHLDQIINIILTNPTITLKKADLNTHLASTSVSFSPLSNLIFCRDQQITTIKGVIMGNLNSKTRMNEVAITKFCLEKLRIKVIGEVTGEGRLEGGDFFPLGPNLCMIGVGLRTNLNAVHYCMDNDLFGTKRVAVVKDCFDWAQERMHLDCIFNIVNHNHCVLLDTAIGVTSTIRRLVDVYERSHDGHYQLVENDIEFSQYLQIIGFSIIPLTQEDQARYGLNFLNLGGGRIITPDRQSARKIAKADGVTGRVEVIEYSHMSHMYGSIHCSTQVLVREAYHRNRLEYARVDSPLVAQRVSSPVFPHESTTKSKHRQNTDYIMMTPPTRFFFNAETSADNSFMNVPVVSRRTISEEALREYSRFHQMLTNDLGINIHVALSDRMDAPDSVFLNNWFSTHPSSPACNRRHMVIYPMKAASRRVERLPESIRRLRQNYPEVFDITSSENEANATFLEGTGVFVLDRVNLVAYMFESPRADPKLAQDWANKLGYTLFNCGLGFDAKGNNIYHTNVIMCIGSKVAICCLSCFKETKRREEFIAKLGATHEIIDISFDQLAHFCGNTLELWSPKLDKPAMIMSDTAFNNFTKEQIETIERNGSVIGHADIPYIEKYGGGGVRCCIAELF